MTRTSRETGCHRRAAALRRGVAAAAVGLALSLGASASGASAPSPRFTTDGEKDLNDGYFKLQWESPGDGLEYQLQTAPEGDFDDARLRYQGSADAFFISGLPEGVTACRVRARSEGGAWSAWSKPLRLNVEHHSLVLALSLFSIGATLFLLTAAFVITHARRGPQAEEGPSDE